MKYGVTGTQICIEITSNKTNEKHAVGFLFNK